MNKLLILIGVLILGVGVLFFLRTPQKSSDITVYIKNYAFTPSTLKLSKGQTVTWINQDIAKHTITDDKGSFNSPFFGKNEKFSYTFTHSGTFSYHCEPHPYMKGTVEVN